MSEFLQRLQDRLKAKQEAKKQASEQPSLDATPETSQDQRQEQQHDRERGRTKAKGTHFTTPFTYTDQIRHFLASHFNRGGQKNTGGVSGFGNTPSTSQTTLTLSIKPISISNALTSFLMLLTAVGVTYWAMRIAQIPGVPSQAANGINKGMTLYSNQDGASAYSLFGNKPIVTDNIYLRGVVVTSKSKDGTLDGFAIFEIDGKPTNAISVGESLGKGLSLQSIGDESATLLYQGQKMNFKLSRSGKEKGNTPKK